MADLDTSEVEKLMGDLKDEYVAKAVEPVISFTQNNTTQIESNDERLNYMFVKKEDIENKVFLKQEYLDTNKIDYNVIVDKQDTGDTHTIGLGKLDKVLPASFFQVKTIEEGTDYYLRKNPDLPEDVAEIMSRYTFGDKQPIKPKPKKTKNKTPDTLEVKKGSFEIDFS